MGVFVILISEDERESAKFWSFAIKFLYFLSTFIDQMVQCGFCGASGHTIRTCGAEGVKEEREKRATDPKYVAQKEKAVQKREEKNESERKRLKLTAASKSLHIPEVIPGHVRAEFGETARNIRGAIDLALPKDYLMKILSILNENR